MGSIDLSVEGVLALGAVILSLLVAERRQRQRLRPAGRRCWCSPSGAAMGFLNGVVHVKLRIPSFMATLGIWFVGVGVANALLGGIGGAHQRPADPRPGASSAFLGLPWGVWLALAAPRSSPA